MRRTILLALFALLFTADTLGIDRMLVRGLSAKNIVLYLFLFGVMLDWILDAKPTKIELPELHLPFIALIVYSLDHLGLLYACQYLGTLIPGHRWTFQ